MSAPKNLLTLTLSPPTGPARKYLGEPGSPHFRPDSPLIDRQILSEEEEHELTRICELVLAKVQSSDNTEDESFLYLASQIQKHDIDSQANAQPDKVQVASAPADSSFQTNGVGQKRVESESRAAKNQPTRRPHDSGFAEESYRSTSFASTVLSQGEPENQLANVKAELLGARWATDESRGHQRLDSSTRKANAWISSYLENKLERIDAHGSTFKEEPRPTSSHVKPTTVRFERPSHRHRRSESNIDVYRIDLNKKLPTVPNQENNRVRPQHITRLMKSFRRRKVTTDESTESVSRATSGFQHQSIGTSSVGQVYEATKTVKLVQPNCVTERHDQRREPRIAIPTAPSIEQNPTSSDQTSGKLKKLFGQRLGSRLDWRRPKLFAISAL